MTQAAADPPRLAPTHAPQRHYPVTADGDLLVGGLPLTRLAERVGSTPFYAYSRDLLRSRVAELRAALPPSVELHYAMKANPMPAVVGFMAGWSNGIDVASAGELKVALDAGADPKPRSASPARASATPSCARRWPPACWSTWKAGASWCCWPRCSRHSAWRRVWRCA